MMPDFHHLRREGIGHLETTGSGAWTDVNTHDPGITILEALAYAITELGYRSGFDIGDLLASADGSQQAFFSARTILTVNPTTPDDLRRLLVDLDTVRNAWVRGQGCPEPRGLYEVLLELEADPALGHLDDRTIVRRRFVPTDGRRRPLVAELRFPIPDPVHREAYLRLADRTASITFTIGRPTRTTTGTTPVEDEELRRHWSAPFYVDVTITLEGGEEVTVPNVVLRLFGDGTVRGRTTVDELVAWLEDPGDEGFIASYRAKLAATARAVGAARAALHAHRNLDEDHCRIGLVEITPIGVCADVEVEPTADIEAVQARIWYELERHLDPAVAFWSRDEMLARGVAVEDLFNGPELDSGFVTADGLAETDLRTDLRVSDILNRLVDLDGVVSVANLRLTAYGADGAPIRGLADPTWEKDKAVFDPERTSASWRLVLLPDHRPRLHRRLSRFTFSSSGLPFRPRTDEAEDVLVQLHGRTTRPPWPAADLDLPSPEGRARQLGSYHPVRHSLPATYGIGPAGLPPSASPLRRAQAKQLTGYLAVFEQLLRNQYAQLEHAADLFSMDPQVRQTYFSRLLDGEEITALLHGNRPDAPGSTGLDAEELARLVEAPEAATVRRHRFLDHLLARFGESFGDHARQLADLQGTGGTADDLLRDKLAFLRAVPRLGHDRGRAFDRTLAPCHPDNASGLHQRVSLLLGMPARTFRYRVTKEAGRPEIVQEWHLVESDRPVLTIVRPAEVTAALDALVGEEGLDASPAAWMIEDVAGRLVLTTQIAKVTTHRELTGSDRADALVSAMVSTARDLLADMTLPDRYLVTKNDDRWQVVVVDAAGEPAARVPEDFDGAQAAARFLAAGFDARSAVWAAHQRAVVVEHLLLRPKFPGDATWPDRDDTGCDCGGDDDRGGAGCGCQDDPYAFRLTYVLPGWTDPYSTTMEMRRFAERTIREQAPSHLLVKTCWVGNDGYLPDPCAPIIDDLAALLEDAAGSYEAACTCAAAVHQSYGEAFAPWLAENALVVAVATGPADLVRAHVAEVLTGVDLSGVPCAPVIDDALRGRLQDLLVEHFTAIAQHGYQFERFEEAWCRWAEADATIDWAAERLEEAVVSLLRHGASAPVPDADLRACAATVLDGFGAGFRAWIESHLAAGTVPDDQQFPALPVPACDAIALEPGAVEAIQALLTKRYETYTDVSYRLHVLVRSLAALRNTYPRATLHDCDEGSDVNPVRLGQTVLGTT